MMAEKSKAIPFLDKPKNLDGMVNHIVHNLKNEYIT